MHLDGEAYTGKEVREGTNISKFSETRKTLLRKIQLQIKKAIKTRC